MTRIETRLEKLEARVAGRQRKADSAHLAALREQIMDLLPHSKVGRARMLRERAEFEALPVAQQIHVTRVKLEQAQARLALELTPKRDGKLDLSCPELPWLQMQWRAIELLRLQGTSPERCTAFNEHAGALARNGRWRGVRDLDPEAAYTQRTKWTETVEKKVAALPDGPAARDAFRAALPDDPQTPFFQTD
jgi:hypothetical protein